MEVNEGKNWMKDKMKKGVKIDLLLALKTVLLGALLAV